MLLQKSEIGFACDAHRKINMSKCCQATISMPACCHCVPGWFHSWQGGETRGRREAGQGELPKIPSSTFIARGYAALNQAQNQTSPCVCVVIIQLNDTFRSTE